MNKHSLFKSLPDSSEAEQFETLLQRPDISIERIVSQGQITPEDEWYDQVSDEWVLLVQGRASLLFKDPDESITLTAGEHIFIAAHRQHRVTQTSREPVCIWLAVHVKAATETQAD